MQAFWLSLGMVFVAELGDKTQLVALSLAARYNTRVVLSGVFVATLVVHLFSVALGGAAGTLLPTDWISFIAGLAFIVFGMWTLRGDCLDDGECARGRTYCPFLVVAVTFFLAELGDKTMLSTVTLAATNSIMPVWIGSSLGMVVSDGLAIAVGRILGTRLPERTVKIGAACIFFAFGIWSAVKGGMRLSPAVWPAAFAVIGAVALLFFRRGNGALRETRKAAVATADAIRRSESPPPDN